jgi:hypothetical protein
MPLGRWRGASTPSHPRGCRISEQSGGDFRRKDFNSAVGGHNALNPKLEEGRGTVYVIFGELNHHLLGRTTRKTPGSQTRAAAKPRVPFSDPDQTHHATL